MIADILIPISSEQVRGTDKAVCDLHIFLLNVVKLDRSTCMSGEDVSQPNGSTHDYSQSTNS